MGAESPDIVAELRAALRTARHGGIELDTLRRLYELARAGDGRARDLIFEHALAGQGVHRTHAASLLVDLVGAVRGPEAPAARAGGAWGDLFERLLVDPVTAYWAVPGLLSARGAAAYGRVTRIARDSDAPVELRAQAVKCLARASGQRFDRDLPSDPGRWRSSDLRLAEVDAWEASGFPEGPGYPPPPRDPGLDRPTSALECLAARLDARLAGARAELYRGEDPANPCMRLVPVAEDVVRRVTGTWDLPAFYREFLTRFSPLRVRIESERFYNDGLYLYGAGELIERQAGYAWSPDASHPLPGWPAGHVVIGDHGGDPFVLDLTGSTGEDAPVVTAEHGAGRWEFEPVAPTFEAFLGGLVDEAGGGGDRGI